MSINLPNVEITNIYVGPKLMYTFNKDGLGINSNTISSYDVVVFCFGEIDVRCHTHTFGILAIDELVYNYLERIKECTKGSDVKKVVYFIPPPAKKINTPDDVGFPFLGTDEERLQYCLYMNKKLLQGCIKYNYSFIDLYDDYCDVDGFLRRDMSDGHVHIKDTVPLIRFIQNKL